MEQAKLMELAQQFPQVSITVPAGELLSFGNAIVSETMAQYRAVLEAQIRAENEEKLLTAREVAALFNVCTKTVTRWKNAGYLTPVPVGGILKYRQSECRRIIEERGRA
ncbi:MAG: helix-turn-helix domain-containing protein [Bacteroidales bacterium]|nr:helix-turn-helix domain-containing protein [Bacteroidales bacterium]